MVSGINVTYKVGWETKSRVFSPTLFWECWEPLPLSYDLRRQISPLAPQKGSAHWRWEDRGVKGLSRAREREEMRKREREKERGRSGLWPSKINVRHGPWEASGSNSFLYHPSLLYLQFPLFSILPSSPCKTLDTSNTQEVTLNFYFPSIFFLFSFLNYKEWKKNYFYGNSFLYFIVFILMNFFVFFLLWISFKTELRNNFFLIGTIDWILLFYSQAIITGKDKSSACFTSVVKKGYFRLLITSLLGEKLGNWWINYFKFNNCLSKKNIFLKY